MFFSRGVLCESEVVVVVVVVAVVAVSVEVAVIVAAAAAAAATAAAVAVAVEIAVKVVVVSCRLQERNIARARASDRVWASNCERSHGYLRVRVCACTRVRVYACALEAGGDGGGCWVDQAGGGGGETLGGTRKKVGREVGRGG